MEQAAADSVKRDDSLKIRRIGLFSEKTAPDWFSELGRTEVITRQDIESCPVQTLEGVLSAFRAFRYAGTARWVPSDRSMSEAAKAIRWPYL